MHIKRIEALRRLMDKKDVSCFLLISDENIFYYTGFSAGSDAYVLISNDDVCLFTDFRYKEQAKIETDGISIIITKSTIKDDLARHINKKGYKDVYFEPKLSYSSYDQLNSKLETVKLVPLYDVADIPRAVKDETEAGHIKKACEIADCAYMKILEHIKPGITERAAATMLEYEMKKNGASDVSFKTTVASGKRSSLPHGTASDKIIEYGDIITFDFGAVYKGYCSDTTRTVFLGRITDEQRKVYDIVYEAQMTALSNIKAGENNFLTDKSAREIIEKNGHGKNFGHGLGHGVGILVHEAPRLSPLVDKNEHLKKDMIVTVEPGIYLENDFGVRIEDTIRVTDEGADIFTNTTKEIIIL